MRILAVHPFTKSERIGPHASGMARVALQLTEGLIAAGNEVRVLPVPEPVAMPLEWSLQPGVSVSVEPVLDLPYASEWIPLVRSSLRLQPHSEGVIEWILDIMALAGLRHAVSSFKPDIIHNHLARRPLPRLVRALGLRTPLVLTHHHGDTGEELLVYDRIGIGTAAARNRVVLPAGVALEKTAVIPSPVDPVFCEGDVPENEERTGIIYAGAVRRRKGIDLLVDAYLREPALRRIPVTVCGIGEDEEEMRGIVARENLPFSFLGRQLPEELAARMRKASWLVNPSRMEAYSAALTEAACCGTPSIGWAEQLPEIAAEAGCDTGLPFNGNVHTADDLVKFIQQAFSGPLMQTAHRKKLAAGARAAFSVARYTARYCDVYRSILGSRA